MRLSLTAVRMIGDAWHRGTRETVSRVFHIEEVNRIFIPHRPIVVLTARFIRLGLIQNHIDCVNFT